MRRFVPYVACLVLIGCATPTPTRRAVAPTTAPSSAVGLNVLALGVSADRKAGLAAAASRAIAPAEAAHVDATVGGAGRLLSNNGAAILSNNSGALVSDNGGGLLSNNGGSLVGKTRFRLLDVADDPPAPVRSGDVVYSLVPSATDAGDIYVYDMAAFDKLPDGAKQPALLDHFAWSNYRKDSGLNNDPTAEEVHADIAVVSSKRLPHFQDVTYTTRYRYTGEGRRELERVTYGCKLHITVPGLPADQTLTLTAEKADLTDLAGGDAVVSTPKRLTMTGEGVTGEVRIDGTQGYYITFQQTTADASASLVEHVTPDGHDQRELEVPSSHLSLRVDTAGGEGDVYDTTSAEKRVGVVSLTTGGQAVATFTDGSSLPLQLF